MVVRRGDVWRAALDTSIGRDSRGAASRGAASRNTRSCVVVSPPELHDFLPTVIVAPMTESGNPAPFRIALRFDGRTGLILLDQVRTLDKSRLVTRLGAVNRATLHASLATLQQTFAP